mmetsp:Transcript_28699/g.27687  ORF Transcript_28699/g.27687 Transcript_28699/m.27687 type:complete len:776 (-) Transcript_28699:2828-5155(-)
MGRLLYYTRPMVTNYQPRNGPVTGGIDVYITGKHLDFSYGGIYCKFGTYVVQATVVRINELVKCETPPAPILTTNNVGPFSLSIDNNYFFTDAEDSTLDFFFLLVPPTVTSITPLVQSVWGGNMISIEGTDFPLEQSVSCRFTFSETSGENVDIKGFVESDTLIKCWSPRYLGVDQQVELSLSFNDMDFYQVSTVGSPLQYLAKPRVHSINPAFGFTDSITYGVELSVFGESFLNMDRASVGNWSEDIPLTIISDTEATLFLPDFINISYFDNTSYFGENRPRLEIGSSSLGYSIDEIVYTYTNHLEISSMRPLIVSLLGDSITLTGSGFINSPALNCRFGPVMAVSVTFLNRTTIKCEIPAIVDQSLNYTVEVTVNGYEYQYAVNPNTNYAYSIVFQQPITVFSILPGIAFMSQENVEVWLQASPIYDIFSLSCKFHDYIQFGIYYKDASDNTFVICTIPSYQFIVNTADNPMNSDGSFIIEVSNNGQDFSTSGLTFKFIVIDQVTGIDPMMGPDTGGTLLSISVKDLPYSATPQAFCDFPGHALQTAIQINDNLVTCITPALALDAEKTTYYELYAVTLVTLEIIGEESSHFNFAYTRTFQVHSIVPPNLYIPTTATYDTTLMIIGEGYLPLENMIKCKLEFSTGDQIVDATFINNHTVSCDVPAPPASVTLPYSLVIEISSMEGDQFSDNDVAFIYRELDVMSSLSPTYGYVSGNSYLTIGYSYFYDLTSNTASCRFTTVAAPIVSLESSIIDYDSVGQKVYCNTPPAYLFS